MEIIAELIGFCAAHAIWCVSEGDPLIPILAYEKPDGKREMTRIVFDKLEDGVAKGQEWLKENKYNAVHSTLLYDGFVTLGSGKTDAIILDSLEYGPLTKSLKMVVPYRNAQNSKGFAVFKPKIVEIEGYDNPDFQIFIDVFFRGVDSHEEGALVWNKHLDQSQ